MDRVAIETKLDSLRRDRGAALLDGRKFDAGEISRLENDLAALDDANGERARRQRAAAQAEWQCEQAQQRARVVTLEADRLAAVAVAEQAARSLAAAIGKVIEVSMDEAAALHKATGAAPMALHRPDVENRLAGRLSAVMQTVKGHRHRVGHIDWIAGHFRPETDWRQAEQDLLQRHIQQLEGKRDGKN